MSAVERLGTEVQRSPVRKIAGYYFLTPVWGREYTQLYIDVVIPAQLAEGNLPAFRGDHQSKYIIYTTQKDAGTILASSSFQALSAIVTPVIEIIDGEIKGPHETMSDCFRRGIKAAEKVQAAAIFLTPDIVFARGSFAALKRLTELGRDVIFVPGLRTLKQGVSPELKARYQSGSAINISPRELMRVALDNLHPLADLSWWEEGNIDLIPANLYWRVGTEGIVARCFHLHPLLVHPQRKNPIFFGTVDDDYFCAACPDVTRDYVVTDSDELFAIELSGPSRMFRTLIPKSSVSGAALWADLCANERHRTLFRYSLRMHAGIGDPSAWARAEAQAEEVANAIFRRLEARPIWRLLVDFDTALLRRMLRWAQDHHLARANGFDTGSRKWLANVAAEILMFARGMLRHIRRSFGKLHDSTSRFLFANLAHPRISSFNYMHLRYLRRDLAALLKNSSRVTVVCSDTTASYVAEILKDSDCRISSAACIDRKHQVQFISMDTNRPLAANSEEFLVCEGNPETSAALDALINEAARVLRPTGHLLLLSKSGPNSNAVAIARNLGQRFNILEIRTQGRFGSYWQIKWSERLRMLALRWPRVRWLLKPLFPIYFTIQVLLALPFNLVVWVADTIDRSRSFHVTSMTLATKK